MASSFTRARSVENKAQRRSQLLRSAARAIQAVGIDAVNMDDVAAEAGIAKSAFYRYFSSKDELFAHVLLEEMDAITDTLRENSQSLSSVDELATVLASACASRPACCALIANLSRTLDKNVAADRLVEIKQGFARSLHAWTQIIASTDLPFNREGAAELAKGCYASIAGLWPLTRDRPEILDAADKAGFSATFGAFEAELAKQCVRLSHGILAERS